MVILLKRSLVFVETYTDAMYMYGKPENERWSFVGTVFRKGLP
jgi:hypothetical protein